MKKNNQDVNDLANAINTKVSQSRKQFAQACGHYLKSKEHIAIIKAFKKLGAVN